MSLVGTLAKVAIGVAVAKGVSNMAKGASRQQAPTNAGSGSIFGDQHSPNGGLGDLLGGLAQGQNRAGQQPSGGLSDILGGIMKQAGNPGVQQNTRQSGGGLADILGSLGNQQPQGRETNAPGGELGDLLGQILGGGQKAQTTQSGGLGGLLEQLAGGMAGGAAGKAAQAPSSGSLGDMLNEALQGGGALRQTPAQAEEEKAAVLLRAIIQAAKSDGRVDAAEKKALLEHLGDVSREEAAFVDAEFQRPVDAAALARDVPRGMEAQVYAMSLMGLDLDSQAEAKYLHELAQALGIDQRTSNQIHQQMGEPVLYS